VIRVVPSLATIGRMTAHPLVDTTAADTTLETWRAGPAQQAVLDFLATVRGEGDGPPVPPEQRVAVFDNDGTLWCEKPMPIQLDFILRRLVEMTEADPSLGDRQPWKAAREQDGAWLNRVITDHYAGDDTKVKVMAGGILAAYAGMSVEEFEERSDTFLRSAVNPVLQRGYLRTAYRPMIDLLDLLKANGFTTYIASGGGRDFMRPVTDELYGVPRERVVGSSATLAYADGTITHTPALEYLDDGPQKPIRIWSRVGRRPLVAGGNSDGDGAMLDFTGRPGLPALRLLVLHDDEEREFAYTAGAEASLERAERDGLTVVSMKNDWTTVF
jgi:phosphoglycolate phosphatase-like HAD superfamily hydrolase